jgi:hypothetical protein
MRGEGCLDYVLDPWKYGTLHASQSQALQIL